MLNHEGSHPEYFEELCALAASGQITEAEFIELQGHLQECGPCRSAYADFFDLLHYELPLADPGVVAATKRPPFFPGGSSYQERFIARARKEGFAVSRVPLQEHFLSRFGIGSGFRLGYPQIATVALAALLVTTAVLAYTLHESHMQNKKLAADKAVLAARTTPQPAIGSALPQTSESPSLVEADPIAALPRIRTSNPDLIKARGDRDTAEAHALALQEQLKTVASELQELRAQNQEASDSREVLERKLKEAEQTANAVRDDLQEIRQARSKDAVTIAAQDLEIQKMAEKLTEQTEMLEQEKALLEASRDVRDLMGARNFHIADVYEVDSKGEGSAGVRQGFLHRRQTDAYFLCIRFERSQYG